jgi:hypothetical protein
MNDWRSRLRDADPVLREPPPDADVRRIRQAVLVAARQRPAAAAAGAWYRPLVALTAMAMVAGAGVTTAWRAGTQRAVTTADAGRADRLGAAANGTAEPVAERQLLHFATPGGTRIIWVFDSTFEVPGTLP